MNGESISSKHETDWERFDALTDEEIDLSEFKSQRTGYQTQINSLLRAHMEAPSLGRNVYE